jgi:ribonuclease D
MPASSPRRRCDATQAISRQRADRDHNVELRARRRDSTRSGVWRNATAAERGLEPDLVLGKDAPMAVAVANPRTIEDLRACEALDDWELPRYGTAVLRALRSAG